MSDQSGKSRTDSPAARPTLKTISQATGLAVATVSRALNDAPDIGNETKKRVREAAEKIGYRPNRAGVRLRTGKTNVISLVISTEHEMTNQHTGRLISSIAGALRGTPYHMIVTPYFPSEDLMVPIDYIVETSSADAIIFNQTEPDDPRAAHLMQIGFPFATHGRTNWSDQHAYYDYDNYCFARIAIEQMAKRGRRSVLILAPPQSQAYSGHLTTGAIDTARKLRMNAVVLETANSDSRPEDVEAGVIAHLQSNPEIDAIVCPSTLAAMTITGAVEKLGLRIGHEIDLFTKQSGGFLQKFRREILTVNEDVKKVGVFLAQAVLHRIEHTDEPPMQTLELPTYIPSDNVDVAATDAADKKM